MEIESKPVKKLKGTSKKINPKPKQVKKKPEAKKQNKGVVYIGHIPYGLNEEGIKAYFEQYGDVLRVKIMRSKKTARSKGYGFIEFADRVVAEIAVESMSGYMLYGTMLDLRLLREEEFNENMLKGAAKKFKYVPWNVIYKQNMNKDKTDEQVVKSLQNLLKADQKRVKRLQDLGFDFEFPMYKDL